jgi:predicted helicase
MDFEAAREMASSAYRLELITARTLHMAGFSVIRGVTDRDAGVDIVARRARANSDELETILIECKGGTRTLASRAIEAFSEKSAQFAADLCVIVTATGWTLDAQNTAERLSVVLVPVEEIGEFVKRLVQERYL